MNISVLSTQASWLKILFLFRIIHTGQIYLTASSKLKQPYKYYFLKKGTAGLKAKLNLKKMSAFFILTNKNLYRSSFHFAAYQVLLHYCRMVLQSMHYSLAILVTHCQC